MTVKSVTPRTLNEWRKWLEKNYLKEKKVHLVLHKKHTGKPTFSHRDAMNEAICFGWIDTTINRVDENKFIRTFVCRNKNSKWSDNTLRYGKELLEQGKMSLFGLKMYKEGLAKKPHDYGIPKNPDMPQELEKALENKKLLETYINKFPPSVRRMHFRQILHAKLPETKQKRVKEIINLLIN